MTQATATDITIGEQIKQNPAINGAIDKLVADVMAYNERITDIRGPVGDLKVHYDELLAKAGTLRGQGLFYPYLSSGAGNGALVELADGSVKWDMICGIGSHFLGHGNPAVIRAQLEASLDATTKHGNLQSGYETYQFAAALLREAQRGSKMAHCFVTTSGAMANESALKVCFQKRDAAPRVLVFADCFMGRSVTMCQIGDSAANRQGVPLSSQVDYMPFFDQVRANEIGQEAHIAEVAAELRRYIRRYPDKHACFIFEIVQGEGGFNPAPREFFVALMDICREHGILVWDDEIQTFGRTEAMFAYDMLDLGEYIDVLTVGKMTQVCAVMFNEECNPRPGLLSGTFTGSSAEFTVGKLLIETLAGGDFYGSDGLFARHHAEFRRLVRAMIAQHPDWFPSVPSLADLDGGVGGMMKFTPFGGDKPTLLKACKTAFDEGVIMFLCGHGPYSLRVLPPLPVMKMEDWPRVFAVIERALAKVANESE